MTIEVREILIKSEVIDEQARVQRSGASPQELKRLKDEILAECRAWLAQQLQARQER